MPKSVSAYFVPKRRVREDVLKKALNAIFGDDAVYQRVWKHEEEGWAVKSSSNVREDWLAILTRHTQTLEERPKQEADNGRVIQASSDRPKPQIDSRALPVRSDSYHAPRITRSEEARHSQYLAGSNGLVGATIIPARTSSKPIRLHDISSQDHIPASTPVPPSLSNNVMKPGRSGPSLHPSSVNRESTDYRLSNTTSRESRHDDQVTRPAQTDERYGNPPALPSLAKAVTEPYLPLRLPLDQSYSRRPSFGQNIRHDDYNAQAVKKDRHSKHVPHSKSVRSNHDSSDDDEEIDGTVGRPAQVGRHNPVSGSRTYGKGDDDDDDDETFGQRRPGNEPTNARHRVRPDDDDDDETFGQRRSGIVPTNARHRIRPHDHDDNDGIVGQAHVVPRSLAFSLPSRPSETETKTRPKSISTTSSQTSSRRTSESSISTRGTSIGATSERGTVASQPGTRDHYLQNLPMRSETRPERLSQDDDSEAPYTDDTDEEPSNGRKMEDSRHRSRKGRSEDTKKRILRDTVGENVYVPRTTSRYGREQRYPKVGRRRSTREAPG